ncbi:hypothetical protein ACT7DO_00690 [Bacillus pacificus]
MTALNDTTYTETNTYNEISFFKGLLWGLVFVVPFLEHFNNAIHFTLQIIINI